MQARPARIDGNRRSRRLAFRFFRLILIISKNVNFLIFPTICPDVETERHDGAAAEQRADTHQECHLIVSQA